MKAAHLCAACSLSKASLHELLLLLIPGAHHRLSGVETLALGAALGAAFLALATTEVRLAATCGCTGGGACVRAGAWSALLLAVIKICSCLCWPVGHR